MHKVELSYVLASGRAPEALIRNPLMDLLAAVRAQGSISGAARVLGQSYRHVWGELKRWEQELGQRLIVWDRGQPARLTEFAEKLLWAERQVQARLAPQIAALHVDLERAFAMAFDPSASVLLLCASHDNALALLAEHCTPARLHLDIRFTGSANALHELNAGHCAIAGFHLPPRTTSDSLIARSLKPLLRPERDQLIGFVRRVQGLALARGNPLNLHSITDVAARGARFVNRPSGTGTRMLLDALCEQHVVDRSALVGYENEEPSHAAVAQAVAAGQADTGLCIEAAARSRDLDFVPLLWEEYFLVCDKATLEQPAVRALQAVLRSDSWSRRLSTLAGYAPARSGEALSLRDVLPWWGERAQRESKQGFRKAGR
ncbi:MAG TPA: substrate-binding domain-containing protein [Burkholderiaceae bacterium]|nr:substrate-binding domain-containing protein [Burkholderiaceae bacterium]